MFKFKGSDRFRGIANDLRTNLHEIILDTEYTRGCGTDSETIRNILCDCPEVTN